MNYNCRYCNKKYGREAKMAEHMDIAHPNVMELSNHKKLDVEDRMQIVFLLKKYIGIVSYIKKPKPKFY